MKFDTPINDINVENGIENQWNKIEGFICYRCRVTSIVQDNKYLIWLNKIWCELSWYQINEWGWNSAPYNIKVFM